MRHVLYNGQDHVVSRPDREPAELVRVSDSELVLISQAELTRLRTWFKDIEVVQPFLGFAARPRSFLTELRARRSELLLASVKKSKKTLTDGPELGSGEPKPRKTRAKKKLSLDDEMAMVAKRFGGL